MSTLFTFSTAYSGRRLSVRQVFGMRYQLKYTSQCKRTITFQTSVTRSYWWQIPRFWEILSIKSFTGRWLIWTRTGEYMNRFNALYQFVWISITQVVQSIQFEIQVGSSSFDLSALQRRLDRLSTDSGMTNLFNV